MKVSFRRIISRGNFIPEIDGLRFIAIVSVVLFHLSGFIAQKDTHDYGETFDFSWLQTLLSRGHLGVPLFFVISGFILGKPFAKHYLAGGKKVDLKQYFYRRLTRLEPPYIIAMTLLLFGAVYVAGNLSWVEAIPSYLASITYTHNFFYGADTLPLLNTVAWSLEVEIQFYIVAPLIALCFLVRNAIARRLLLTTLTVFFIAFDYAVELPFISILDYFEYFFVGFLLADLYVTKSSLFKASRLDGVLSLGLFVCIWLFDTEHLTGTAQKFSWEVVQLLSIFLLYYLVIFHKSVSLLANSVVTNIGGMCYSIYLLHYVIISVIGNPVVTIDFFGNVVINTLVYGGVLIGAIMVASVIFFLLIERPCMDKEWPEKLLDKLRGESKN